MIKYYLITWSGAKKTSRGTTRETSQWVQYLAPSTVHMIRSYDKVLANYLIGLIITACPSQFVLVQFVSNNTYHKYLRETFKWVQYLAPSTVYMIRSYDKVLANYLIGLIITACPSQFVLVQFVARFVLRPELRSIVRTRKLTRSHFSYCPVYWPQNFHYRPSESLWMIFQHQGYTL